MDTNASLKKYQIELSRSSSDIFNHTNINQLNNKRLRERNLSNCRKCKSYAQLASNDKVHSVLYGNFAGADNNKKYNRHSIQIPTAASTITLTIPKATSVYFKIKQENFLLNYLQGIFQRCKVTYYISTSFFSYFVFEHFFVVVVLHSN